MPPFAAIRTVSFLTQPERLMPKPTSSQAPLRLGIAGLGTVGVGVIKIIQRKANLIAQRTGRPVVVTAVSARSKDKDRGVDISSYAWKTIRSLWRCARTWICSLS